MSLDDITLAVDYFDLKKIAESGQCFRWKELGPGKYLIPSSQTCAIMEQKEPDDDLHLLIEEGTLPLWQDYLNYGERYGSIVREAREATLADGSPDLFLREAVLEAAGVQILTHLIDWPWVWVLAPIWIPTGIVLAAIVVVLIVVLTKETIRSLERRNRR